VKNGLSHYLHTKGIDSVQKLNFLLFLQRHPNTKGTPQEFAERLYLGDTVLLEKIIIDLQFAGLVERVQHNYKLRDEPTVKSDLQELVASFEDPLTRQELLNQVRADTAKNPDDMI